jgi:hypothetical protein
MKPEMRRAQLATLLEIEREGWCEECQRGAMVSALELRGII